MFITLAAYYVETRGRAPWTLNIGLNFLFTGYYNLHRKCHIPVVYRCIFVMLLVYIIFFVAIYYCSYTFMDNYLVQEQVYFDYLSWL